jgi:hypothetical protein
LAQNVIRWSLVGLSTAAIITLVIISSVSKPHDLNIDRNKTAQTVSTDSTVPQKASGIASIDERKDSRNIPDKIQNKIVTTASLKPSSSIPEINNTLLAKNDSLSQSSAPPRIIIDKINVASSVDLKGDPVPNTLIAINPSAPVPEYDDGRSKLSRFIARTFREKILKENRAKDSPLKAYELAKAGVSGLDKLLGWEMALSEKKDINGELKSVYFSSKILKFNAPIKKTEPRQ